MTKLAENIRNDSSGFTLLEVLIAMSIMVVAFTSILSIQSSNLRSSAKAKRMNIIGMLARNALIQTEIEIKGKKFSEIPEEANGKFETPYEEFTWVRKIAKVEFPTISFNGGKKEGEGDSKGEEGSDSTTDQLAQMVSKFLSKALREVSITVIWNAGKFEQKYNVSMYWVDLDTELSISP